MQPPLILFLLCLLVLSSGHALRCSDRPLIKQPGDPKHLCVVVASRLLASGLVSFHNGSCLLLDVCERNPAPSRPCPVFVPLRTDRRLLLLRTKAKRKISPLYLLRGLFLHSAVHQEVRKENWPGPSFKTPLLRSPGLRRLVSRVELQLVRADGSVGARLEFSVTTADGFLGDGKWFAKSRLVGAWPWSLAKMRNEKYAFFTIQDKNSSGHVRQFYILFRHGRCTNDQGYILVTWNDGCGYETGTRSRFLWTAKGDGPGLFYESQEAAEFRLYATLSGSDVVYYHGEVY